MVIFNDSNQHINEDIIFELTNMTMYNTNGSTKVNASVAPGDFKVFLVHRVGEQKCGFKFKAAMKQGGGAMNGIGAGIGMGMGMGMGMGGINMGIPQSNPAPVRSNP